MTNRERCRRASFTLAWQDRKQEIASGALGASAARLSAVSKDGSGEPESLLATLSELANLQDLVRAQIIATVIDGLRLGMSYHTLGRALGTDGTTIRQWALSPEVAPTLGKEGRPA